MAHIQFLHSHTGKDGTVHWHWKPSPRLRKAGFVNQKLGTVERDAVNQALDLNEKVAEWEARGRAALPDAPVPRRWTFADLVDAYEVSDDFTTLGAATKREYRTRLRQLTTWAQDGQLPLLSIDKAMVRDLKKTLGEGGASAFKIAAIMRVLRLLLNWAEAAELVEKNATDGVKIRTPPARSVVLVPELVMEAAALARRMDMPAIALGITLGLWTVQRQADLLAANRMTWREMTPCAPADRAVLAGRDGVPMGLRLQQHKTGKWIDAPVLPEFHQLVADAFARSQWLICDDKDPSRACPQHLFQRRVRQVFAAAGLDGAQFRDLRRSGMCMMRELGIEDSSITAISGHMVMGKRTILDVYMPSNTRIACAAMAMAARERTARAERQDTH